MERKLEEMTKAELYELAQQQNVRGRGKMRKAELVKTLSSLEMSRPLSSSGLSAPAEGVPEKPAQAAPEQVSVSEPSPLTSPPPHPSAPQYLTPPPVEVYQGEEGPPLSDHVPVTVLEAIPRDPHWVFLYWEVRPEDKEEAKSRYGEWVFERSLSVLRVHDLETELSRDIPVLLDARNWYLPVMPDRMYQFELGLIIAGGQFVALTSSRKVRTPAAEPSFHEEEAWLAIEEYFRELVELYGDFAPGSFLSSPAGRRLGKREGARIGWSGVTPIRPWGERG